MNEPPGMGWDRESTHIRLGSIMEVECAPTLSEVQDHLVLGFGFEFGWQDPDSRFLRV